MVREHFLFVTYFFKHFEHSFGKREKKNNDLPIVMVERQLVTPYNQPITYKLAPNRLPQRMNNLFDQFICYLKKARRMFLRQ